MVHVGVLVLLISEPSWSATAHAGMGTNILTTDSLPDVDTSGYIPPDVGERYGPIIEKADGFAQVSVLPAPLSDAAGHSFGEPVHYSCVCALSFGGNINGCVRLQQQLLAP